MSLKYSTTTCSGLDWDVLQSLLHKLRRDKLYKDYLLIGTGCYCGFRLKDLLSLRWVDVLNKDEFSIIEHKTKKKRTVTVNPQLKEIFKVAFAAFKELGITQDSHLFLTRYNNVPSKQYINRRLHKVYKIYRVKVQNGSSHTLRKTFGKRVWEMDNKSERSLIYLSEIFSHNSISTTKRYIGIVQKDIENIYLNL